MQEGGTKTAPHLREKYERDGYLILEDVGVTEELLNGIVADLTTKYPTEGDRNFEDDVLYTPNRSQDAWRVPGNARALALSPKVLDLLEELHGRGPLAVGSLNLVV